MQHDQETHSDICLPEPVVIPICLASLGSRQSQESKVLGCKLVRSTTSTSMAVFRRSSEEHDITLSTANKNTSATAARLTLTTEL